MMGPEFTRGTGFKLARALAVTVALTSFAATSHASGFGAGCAPWGRSYGSARFIGGGFRYGYCGGYGGYRVYRAPVRCYRAPRSYFSLGIGFGWPGYYAPPVYVYDAPRVVAPAPRVYREPAYDDRRDDRDYDRDDHRYYDRDEDRSRHSREIDVENEPPAGSYYHDPFCNRTFSTLDDYTEHLQSHHHTQTIEIIERSSGDRLRTLEFVDGYWQVQQ